MNNLSIEYLNQKRSSLGDKKYRKYLKNLMEAIESRIIKLAQRGEERNKDLEAKLRLVDNEIKK